MSAQALDRDSARAIIRARLGRSAQDALEAAVVLEAWGGLPASEAMSMGTELGCENERGRPGLVPPEERGERDSILAEAIAMMLAIIAVAGWAGPLGDQIGNHVLSDGLVAALPATLGLQWLLRGRYLSRRAAMRVFARDGIVATVLVAAIIGGLAAIPGSGLVAAMFVTVFTGGAILARRGWALWYALLLVAEAIGLHFGLSAVLSLSALTAIITLGCVAAVVSSFWTAPTDEIPGRFSRAFVAGLLGTLLGCLLVADPTLGWGIHGVFPALALLPSLVGGFWSGYHLWRFADEVPRGLRGVPLSRGVDVTSTGPAMSVVAGSVARLVGATLVLSLIVMALGRWTSGYDEPTLFAAFGAATLVTLFVGLFEALGYVRWALLCAAAGFGAELLATRVAHLHLSGGGLLIGGLVGALIATGPLLRALNRPGRTLATALWVQ